MPNRINNDRELWRVILLRRNASEFLARKNEDRYTLPRVEISKGARVAQALNDQLKTAWNLDTFALYPLRMSCVPVVISHVHLLETVEQDATAPVGAEWILRSTLDGARFADMQDAAALRAWYEDSTALGTNQELACVGLPGSLPHVRNWVEQAVQPFGLKIGKQFSQLTADKSFSLIRFETDGPAVWFKAVGQPNLHEFPISRELARVLPAFVPGLLAVHEDWNAWLSLEVEGYHPDESSKLNAWIDIATTLADFQIASIGKTFLFVDAGCRDVRVPALSEVVKPFLQVAAELMEEQTSQCSPPLHRQEIRTLGDLLLDALAHLGDVDLPNTLGHLDFNPGNILVKGERIVFLDWSAACVGCPLFTMEYLLERLRRLHPSRPTWTDQVLAAYVDPWLSLVPPSDIKSALAVTPLLAVLAYALAGGAWNDPQRRREPETAAHLRSLTRRMNREAALWVQSTGHRSICRQLR